MIETYVRMRQCLPDDDPLIEELRALIIKYYGEECNHIAPETKHMRKLIIELDLENAVYRTPGDTIDYDEIADQMHVLAENLREGNFGFNILDANGNRCGSCYILERDDP